MGVDHKGVFVSNNRKKLSQYGNSLRLRCSNLTFSTVYQPDQRTTSKRLNNNSRGCASNPRKRNAHFPATLKRVELFKNNRANIEPFQGSCHFAHRIRRLHLRLLLLNPNGFDSHCTMPVIRFGLLVFPTA
jgi:hypothetical protein